MDQRWRDPEAPWWAKLRRAQAHISEVRQRVSALQGAQPWSILREPTGLDGWAYRFKIRPMDCWLNSAVRARTRAERLQFDLCLGICLAGQAGVGLGRGFRLCLGFPDDARGVFAAGMPAGLLFADPPCRLAHVGNGFGDTCVRVVVCRGEFGWPWRGLRRCFR